MTTDYGPLTTDHGPQDYGLLTKERRESAKGQDKGTGENGCPLGQFAGFPFDSLNQSVQALEGDLHLLA